MLIHVRYFIIKYIKAFALIGFTITCLMWVSQAMKLLYVITKGVSLFEFVELVLLILPSLLFSILPIITLITTLFVYNNFKENKQILALQTSGLSDVQLVKPAIIASLCITILSLIISSYILPLSYKKLRFRLNDLKSNYISNIIESRKFNQISYYATIYTDYHDGNGNLNGIIIFDKKSPEGQTILYAKSGNFSHRDKKIYFELDEGLRQSYDKNLNPQNMNFDKLFVEIDAGSQDTESGKKKLLEMFLSDMLWPSEDLDVQRQRRLRAEGHMRIIWPIYSLAFTIITLSYFIKIKYSRKTQWSAIIMSIIPAIILSLLHLALQKFAITNNYIIIISYFNLLSAISYGIYRLKYTFK